MLKSRNTPSPQEGAQCSLSPSTGRALGRAHALGGEGPLLTTLIFLWPLEGPEVVPQAEVILLYCLDIVVTSCLWGCNRLPHPCFSPMKAIAPGLQTDWQCPLYCWWWDLNIITLSVSPHFCIKAAALWGRLTRLATCFCFPEYTICVIHILGCLDGLWRSEQGFDAWRRSLFSVCFVAFSCSRDMSWMTMCTSRRRWMWLSWEVQFSGLFSP